MVETTTHLVAFSERQPNSGAAVGAAFLQTPAKHSLGISTPGGPRGPVVWGSRGFGVQGANALHSIRWGFGVQGLLGVQGASALQSIPKTNSQNAMCPTTHNVLGAEVI